MKKKLTEWVIYGVFTFLCAWGIFWLFYVAFVVDPILLGLLFVLAIAFTLLCCFNEKEDNNNDR